MSTLRNKVSLVGRLGANPEVVKFDSGKTLARFSIATNESFKDKNGAWQENTQWHTVNAWGKNADLVGQLFKKGQEVLIQGRLVNNIYESAKGEKRYSTVVEMSDFIRFKPTENHAS